MSFINVVGGFALLLFISIHISDYFKNKKKQSSLGKTINK